jgi:protease secretion system membrane fusion protein
MTTNKSSHGAILNTNLESNALQQVVEEEINTQQPIRLGAAVLVVGFGAFLLWAGFAPLDQGVPASGTVAIETRKKTIQHSSGGVVKDVLVKEGQWVKEGEVLLEVSDTQARANNETIKQAYLSQRTVEARLEAERNNASNVAFGPEILESKADLFVQQVMLTQQTLFAARRASYNSEVSALEQSIQALKDQLWGVDQSLANRLVQIQLQEKHLKSIKTLAEEGYAPKNQVLQMEQMQTELKTALSDLKSNQSRLSRSIEESQFRLVQRKQDVLKDVLAQLAEVKKEIQAGKERLTATSEELARTQIKSPVEGQVVGMGISATGGVVMAGQKLMDIVPKSEALLVDAKVQPHIIDKVHTGMEVSVRFNTFANTPQLVVPGKLVALSSDVITDPSAGMAGVSSYYLGRVEITTDGLKILGNRVLQPGMPTEVLFKVGERTLLQYIMYPLTKRIAASLKEE